MNGLKKFFNKKKAEARFKAAGPGVKLSDPSGPSSSKAPSRPKKDVYQPPERSGLTAESKQAANAALARMEGKRTDAPGFNTSLAAIRAQAKREIEAEKRVENIETEEKPTTVSDGKVSARFTVEGVLFRCPVISNEILSFHEWQDRIREFLKEQAGSDPSLAGVLMIHSLHNNKDKIKGCVDTLIKYLENILQNPTEEKYRKIRKTNKVFLERVAPFEGADLVLEGAGFESEGEFYVLPDGALSEENLEHLEMLVDALKCAEPIGVELDRNMQVLLPAQANKQQELPRGFFKITPEDLKREQQNRVEAYEKSQMLMTQAMREKEKMRELQNYRYCLIRVRFPDGMTLQGTFGVHEPFQAVTEFIRESIITPDDDFALLPPFGETIPKEEERSLFELKFIPATLFIFKGSEENGLDPEIILNGVRQTIDD